MINNAALDKKEPLVINDNYLITGIVKFNIQDKNISSRFKFIRKNGKDKNNVIRYF